MRYHRADLSSSLRMVLPHSVVDNSDFSANRFTALVTPLILASQGALYVPISSSEDSDDLSSVFVPARGLPPSLSDAALAS